MGGGRRRRIDQLTPACRAGDRRGPRVGLYRATKEVFGLSPWAGIQALPRVDRTGSDFGGHRREKSAFRRCWTLLGLGEYVTQ
jgi:hypothetical protein